MVLITLSAPVYAQTDVQASEIINQFNDGKALNFENVTIVGDLDLSNLKDSKSTCVYPEKGKKVDVITNFVTHGVLFKNCVFKGKFILFHLDNSGSMKKEFRVQFNENVVFEKCVFEQSVDFELTNFNKAVSFESSNFKAQPRLVRMGVYQKPNLTGLILEKGCLFQFDQTKKAQVFTLKELMKVAEAM